MSGGIVDYPVLVTDDGKRNPVVLMGGRGPPGADGALGAELAAPGGASLIGSLENNVAFKARNGAGTADHNILVYDPTNWLKAGSAASGMDLLNGLVRAAVASADAANFNVYGISESTRRARVHLVPSDSGAHSGIQHSLFGIEGRVTGSGVNGPTNSDIGFTASMIKLGWPLAGAAIGEIDGISSVVRQCGPTSDAAGFLADVAGCNHTGFLCAFEGATQRLDNTTFATIQGVRAQTAVLDNIDGESIAFYGEAETGTINNGLLLRSIDGSNRFTDYITCVDGGSLKFDVAGDGTVTMGAFASNSDVPVTGYVAIKTIDGTTRKLAVIA